MSLCLSCGNDQYSCICVFEEDDAEHKAICILRAGCEKIDGLAIEKQGCPEDMAMWAITKIERLQKALDEILAGKVSVKVTRRKR